MNNTLTTTALWLRHILLWHLARWHDVHAVSPVPWHHDCEDAHLVVEVLTLGLDAGAYKEGKLKASVPTLGYGQGANSGCSCSLDVNHVRQKVRER